MKPAPPVTRQFMSPRSLDRVRLKDSLDPARERAWSRNPPYMAGFSARPQKGGGPAPRRRYGPDRRTTLVGLGAVRRPARKGAMLAGPSDFRVEPKHSAAGTCVVKHLGHNWTSRSAWRVHQTRNLRPCNSLQQWRSVAVRPV